MAARPRRSASRVHSSVAALLWVALAASSAAAWPPFTGPGGESLRPQATAGSATEAVWWPQEPPRDSWHPVGVLRLASEALILVDRVRNRMFRFTAPDQPFGRLPAPDTAPVEWTAVASAPGLSFYVLDGPGRRIQQYDFRGDYLGVALDLQAVALAEGLGGVDPGGLAVDRTGRAVVTDRLGDRLLEFGPGWTFLGEWGQTGTAPGAWRRPGAACVGTAPPFLIADEGNARLVLVDEFGEPLSVRRVNDTVRGLAALDAGRFAVSTRDTVRVLDESLRTLETYALPRSAACGSRHAATEALSGDATCLYVGDACTGRIAQLRRAGR